MTPVGLREFFEAVYVPRRLRQRNANTLRMYAILFRHLQRFLRRAPLLSDLNEDTLSRFLDHFGHYHVPRGSNKLLAQLMALARFAVLKGMLPTIPDLLPVPEPKRIPQAYTLTQAQALLAAAGECRGEICGIPAPLFWTAFFRVGIECGFRVGALFKILRRNVDLEQRTIFVPAESQKQYADQRLRFSKRTLAAIRAIWYPERKCLFPWNLDPSSRYNHLDRILRRAGLPLGRLNKFQKLRRTCASLGKRYGADATAQLGHSSEEVTRRWYLDTSDFVQTADVLPEFQLPDSRQLTLF